jgi:hypothetical protein
MPLWISSAMKSTLLFFTDIETGFQIAIVRHKYAGFALDRFHDEGSHVLAVLL